jgi:hypothetical protein
MVTLSLRGNLNLDNQFYAVAKYSSYTPDGLFNGNALPCYVGTYSGGKTIFGYADAGEGQYTPRIGFYIPPSAYQTSSHASIGIEPQTGYLTLDVDVGTIKLNSDTVISHTNAVYLNVNSIDGSATINLQRGGSTKGWFGTDGTTKAYLVAAEGLNLEFDANGGQIIVANDFVAQGLIRIKNNTPVLDLCLANGDLKLDVGYDGSNGYINSRASKLILTGQGGTNDAFWFYGGHLSVRGGYHIIPESYEGGYCGNSSHRWYGGYIRTVYTLGGGQYDMYDDLAIAKLWGEQNPTWPSDYDPNKAKPEGAPFDFLKPKNENGEPDEYFNLNSLVGFAMSCLKTSARKFDEQDQRFDAVMLEIENLRSQIQQLSSQQ